jgi:hypothetical protein
MKNAMSLTKPEPEQASSNACGFDSKLLFLRRIMLKKMIEKALNLINFSLHQYADFALNLKAKLI